MVGDSSGGFVSGLIYSTALIRTKEKKPVGNVLKKRLKALAVWSYEERTQKNARN